MLSAKLKFMIASEQTPVYCASQSGANAQLELEGQFEEITVNIANGRPTQEQHSLDREGFQLVQHKSEVDNFYDPKQIENVYNREVVQLIKGITGAQRIEVFDHTHRADSDAQRTQLGAREPSNVVHNDYTVKSAKQRIIDLMPASEIDALLGQRFAIINVWRAISHPAQTSQLALCDSTSLKAGSGYAVERRAKDRIGELMMASFDPDNRWFYFPSISPEEALLLKTFDSDGEARASFCLHSAFDNPQPPPNARPRESIETRVLAFF